MQYKHLGRTGLQVSRLALGTMNFGELTDEIVSFEIMDKALDAGINFFDTADVYLIPWSPIGMGLRHRPLTTPPCRLPRDERVRGAQGHGQALRRTNKHKHQVKE